MVHPGIEPPAPPTEVDRKRAREELGIPTGRTVIGMVSRLQPWKGQHRALRAIAMLRERGHDVHGLFVGGTAYDLSPEYEPYVRRLADDLGLSPRVTFTGHVVNPSKYIPGMDVLLNASEREPFGVGTLEGMAHAVPTVVVGDGGSAEVVEHERSGLIAGGYDPTHLANGLERLITDTGLRERLGAAARERVLSRFTARHLVDNLQRNLEDVALDEL